MSRCKSCLTDDVKEHHKNNKEKWNKYQRDYYKEKPYIYINNVNNRAQRKKKATFQLDEFYSFLLVEFYDLAKRKSLLLGEPYEVDHIIPLQGNKVSGLNVPWNMQVITRTENRTKSNKELTELK